MISVPCTWQASHAHDRRPMHMTGVPCTWQASHAHDRRPMYMTGVPDIWQASQTHDRRPRHMTGVPDSWQASQLLSEVNLRPSVVWFSALPLQNHEDNVFLYICILPSNRVHCSQQPATNWWRTFTGLFQFIRFPGINDALQVLASGVHYGSFDYLAVYSNRAIFRQETPIRQPDKSCKQTSIFVCWIRGEYVHEYSHGNRRVFCKFW